MLRKLSCIPYALLLFNQNSQTTDTLSDDGSEWSLTSLTDDRADDFPRLSIKEKIAQVNPDDLVSTTHRGVVYTFKRSIVTRWRRAAEKALLSTDVWFAHGIDRQPTEKCRRYRYSAVRMAWTEDEVQVKLQKEPFARGAMRECFRMKKLSRFSTNVSDWQLAHNCVAKRYMSDVHRDAIFEDVKLQMDAKLWAEEYNRHDPPKQVDIAQMSVIEFVEREGSPLYHMEHFIEGEYIKYNSNSGFVSELARQTPHAFSHFSFERSGHGLIVIDIQGVGDLYTDPQIHTADARGYGSGNLGTKGMALFFHTHACNEICAQLDLSPFDLSPKELAAHNEFASRVRRTSRTVVNRDRVESVVPLDGVVEAVGSADDTTETSSTEVKSPGEYGVDDPDWFDPTDRLRRRLTMDHEEIVDEEQSVDPNNGQAAVVSNKLNESSDAASSTTKDDDGDKYWKDMGARPSRIEPRESSSTDSKTPNPYGSVLGQVHLDMCRYYELGRFKAADATTTHSDEGGEYDKASAWFHLEMAAECKVIDAMLTIARIYLGMSSDLLKDFEVDSDDVVNADRGLDMLEMAAECGDRDSMLYMADAYETDLNLGSTRTKSMSLAVDWYERALACESDSADGYTVTHPRHVILAKLANMYRVGDEQLQRSAERAGEYYSTAADAAMEAMKGKMATKYYALSEECYAEGEE